MSPLTPLNQTTEQTNEQIASDICKVLMERWQIIARNSVHTVLGEPIEMTDCYPTILQLIAKNLDAKDEANQKQKAEWLEHREALRLSLSSWKETAEKLREQLGVAKKALIEISSPNFDGKDTWRAQMALDSLEQLGNSR